MSDWEPAPPTKPFGSPRSGETRVGSEASPEVVAQIVDYVQRALSNHGTPGKVEYYDGRLMLLSNPESTPFNILPWVGIWDRLDEETKKRHANDAARQLRARSDEGSAPKSKTLIVDVRYVIIAAMLAISGFFIFSEDLVSTDTEEAETSRAKRIDRREDTVGRSDEATKEVATTGRPLSEARSSRVCSATMNRVFQGGTVSVADVDGWVVEIALAQVGGKSPLDTHPALNKFVENPAAPGGSKFVWKEEPNLVTVDTSDTLVTVTRSSIGTGPKRIPAVKLAFGGTLVDAYFKEDGRAAYYHIADALTDALDATHSALYARCFDAELHALGSWFRGLDGPGAATSMVYFMGTYAKPLHIARPFWRTPGSDGLNRLHAFKSISKKTRPLRRDDLSTLVGKEGGMATGTAGNKVIITFPFRDGNRASRASRNVTRVTSLGL